MYDKEIANAEEEKNVVLALKYLEGRVEYLQRKVADLFPALSFVMKEKESGEPRLAGAGLNPSCELSGAILDYANKIDAVNINLEEIFERLEV